MEGSKVQCKAEDESDQSSDKAIVNPGIGGNPESNEDEDRIVIDPDQIQIKADAEELNRRIECFISRKREQANQANIQKFCAYSGQTYRGGDDDDDGTCTCARVNAFLIKQEDSKSHIKVRRVFNQWSHQNTAKQSPVNQTTTFGQGSYPPALDERLSVTERILGVNKPVPLDVYERMKKIEDRLAFLESISPEYKDLWAIDDCDSVKSFDGDSDCIPMKKRTHSMADLDSKLEDTEERYVKKAR